MIKVRQIEVAIPKKTNTQQWQQIEQAISYAKLRKVKLNVTMVK